MTDIPDEIIERCARAICLADYGIDFSDAQLNTRERYLQIARAAIVSMRYLEMKDAMEKLLDQSGWRGSGENDREIYYCEHCKASNADCSKIEHTADCLITSALAALSPDKDEP